MLTFFIKRPRFAMVIALVITLLGAIALRIIPVEQYPQITPPVVNVSASWPGASSADVAEAIATPPSTCRTAWRRPWRSCPPRRSKTACRCASGPLT